MFFRFLADFLAYYFLFKKGKINMTKIKYYPELSSKVSFPKMEEDVIQYKNDIIKVISKYMEIDCQGLDIQITQTESEGANGTVPALCANIPILDMKQRSSK